MSDVRRGTVLSFDATTWTAMVLLDGSEAESQMPVGQWVPATQLTVGLECAVLIFGDTNTDDGLVLGAYGAVGTTDTPTFSALNIGAATGATAGTVRIGTTSANYGNPFEMAGAGYTSLAVRSTDASGVIAILAANAASELRLGTISNHAIHLYTNGAATATLSTAAGLNLLNAAGVLKVNGTQVVAARQTGWAAWTGTATRTSKATSTATLANVAEALKALIDDLISHGLIGP